MRSIVEQKNGSAGRRSVGYGPYDSPEQLDLLNTLYAHLHCCVNFFLPVKLENKVRFASKVTRVCDDPQTPHARVLASHQESDEDKAEPREAQGYLGLVALRRRIHELQVQLLETLSPAG